MKIEFFSKNLAIIMAVFLSAVPQTAIAANLNVGMRIATSQISSSSNAKFTCYAAKSKLSQAGYQKIVMINCSGLHYQFGAQLHSKSYRLGFDALNGIIITN